MVDIPLNLDRLRAEITALCNPLRFVTRNSLFHQLSLTKLEVLQPHDRRNSRLVNYQDCASHLVAMLLNNAMNRNRTRRVVTVRTLRWRT